MPAPTARPAHPAQPPWSQPSAAQSASSHRASGRGPRGAKRPGRQWGRDRRTRSLPVVPEPVSDRRIALGRLAIIVTVTAWLGYFFTWLLRDLLNPIYSR